jgi:hypothetical protein
MNYEALSCQINIIITRYRVNIDESTSSHLFHWAWNKGYHRYSKVCFIPWAITWKVNDLCPLALSLHTRQSRIPQTQQSMFTPPSHYIQNNQGYQRYNKVCFIPWHKPFKVNDLHSSLTHYKTKTNHRLVIDKYVHCL